MTEQALPSTVRDRLALIKGRWTMYEIELLSPDGRRYLVCYTPRRSFRGLIDAVRARSREIRKVAGLGDDNRGERRGTALHMDNGAVIRFTGRTARDAIIGGELPYIGRCLEERESN